MPDKKKRRAAPRKFRRASSRARSRASTQRTPAPARTPRRLAPSTDRTAQVHVGRVQVTGPVASQMYGVSKEWLRRHPGLAEARRKINNKTILYRVDKLDDFFRGFDAA